MSGAGRIAVIGSLTRDEVTVAERRTRQLGGVVWHAGAILASLGVETAIATCLPAGAGEARAALSTRGIELHDQDDVSTTDFHNDYDAAGHRTQRVGHVARPIRRAAVAGAIAGADIVHLGPLHPDDIADSALDSVRAAPARLALDVQGFTRAIRDGRIVPELSDRLGPLLPACHVVKADRGEAALIVGSDDPVVAAERFAERFPGLEVLITCSVDGIVLAADGAPHRLDCRPVETLDPTGAGDVFLAAYLRARLRGDPPIAAAGFALGTTAAELANPSRLVELDPT